MAYKFQRLEIYQLALEYIDLIYALCEKLPRSEDFNLKSQITRAANSIALNIAEGSTSQSDAEQARFLGMALRSLIETVACQDIIQRRQYLTNEELEPARALGSKLFAKIQSMRKSLGHAGGTGGLSFGRLAVAGRRS
jgi:four helix bundle protein